MTDIIDATDAIEATCLPTDLVRVILEWLFDMHQTHRKTTQLELLTLSKEVKIWLEPLLFRHISMPRRFSPGYMSHISRAHRFAASIRTIFMSSASIPSISLLVDILQTNGSVSQLVVCDWVNLEGNDYDYGAKIYQTKVPSLRRLSMLIRHESTEIPEPKFPIFESLTHLFMVLATRLGASPDEETATLNSIIHPIRSLKSLTHLALDIRYIRGSCNPALDVIPSHLPSSTTTVILNMSDGNASIVSIEWLLKACDPRLVFVLVNYWDDKKRESGLFLDRSWMRIAEWEENPPPLDMWESAELALERRRQLQADVRRQGQGL